MVRFPIQVPITEDTVYAEGFCKSTDEKPVKLDGKDLITGSSLFEVDTSNAYLFEEEGKTWVKQGNNETPAAETTEETVQDGD